MSSIVRFERRQIKLKVRRGEASAKSEYFIISALKVVSDKGRCSECQISEFTSAEPERTTQTYLGLRPELVFRKCLAIVWAWRNNKKKTFPLALRFHLIMQTEIRVTAIDYQPTVAVK